MLVGWFDKFPCQKSGDLPEYGNIPRGDDWCAWFDSAFSAAWVELLAARFRMWGRLAVMVNEKVQLYDGVDIARQFRKRILSADRVSVALGRNMPVLFT